VSNAQPGVSAWDHRPARVDRPRHRRTASPRPTRRRPTQA